MKHQVGRRAGLIVVAFTIVAVLGLGAVVFALTGAGDEHFTIPRQSASFIWSLLNEGKIAEARKGFEEEFRKNPKNVEALRGLAQCALEDGDDEAALAYLHQLTGLAPKDRSAWRKLALCASRLGKDMEALSAAQTALSLAPQGDRAMSDLMTRILTSDTSPLANPMKGGPAQPWDPEHSVHGNRGSTFDPLSEIPLPEPPDPTRGLPGVGRAK